MREIKFRAYRPAYGMTEPFTLGDLQDNKEFTFTGDSYLSWDEFGLEHPDTILMQYTGFHDKNDVSEIYADYIMRRPDGTTYLVYWWDGCFLIDDVEGTAHTSHELSRLSESAHFDEVIGNIWENPELMEEI